MGDQIILCDSRPHPPFYDIIIKKSLRVAIMSSFFVTQLLITCKVVCKKIASSSYGLNYATSLIKLGGRGGGKALCCMIAL